jgi:EAL domain-containing protein (putative c-di-GMP-specific phosphodiesterase class I)
MHERTESWTIIKTVLALARSLGLTTTGEGVETSQMADALRSEGCTYLQRYVSSKPLLPDAVEHWLGARADSDPPSAGNQVTPRRYFRFAALGAPP